MFHFKQKNENKLHQYKKQPFAATKCEKERKNLLHDSCQFKEDQAVIKNKVWFKWVVERKKNHFPTDV
jgi:hypothetical protein